MVGQGRRSVSLFKSVIFFFFCADWSAELIRTPGGAAHLSSPKPFVNTALSRYSARDSFNGPVRSVLYFSRVSASGYGSALLDS